MQYKNKQIPENWVIFVIQNMNDNKQAVETVNFWVYFKVIIRRNET